MKAYLLVFVCIVLISGLVFCAGCTSSTSMGNATVITPAPSRIETQSVTLPVTSLPGVPVPAPSTTTVPADTPPEVTPVPTTTWIQKSSVTDAADDPQIVVLQFSKEYFSSDLPDCGMRMAFPQVATDPGYGILEPERTLTAFTRDQVLAFLAANARQYASDPQEVDPYISNYIDPNTLGGANCTGTAATPTWNFVRIDATIMPRNARPADYDIGISVRSKGKVAAQIKLNRTLTLDQPVIYELYVPVKTSETDLFDSIEMVFYKKA
ncbi:MAG: hypothetical protein LUQ71_08425 [Methanoregula sp.]|nr:hypothetical protein [Methanoregula sp.]